VIKKEKMKIALNFYTEIIIGKFIFQKINKMLES